MHCFVDKDQKQPLKVDEETTTQKPAIPISIPKSPKHEEVKEVPQVRNQFMNWVSSLANFDDFELQLSFSIWTELRTLG